MTDTRPPTWTTDPGPVASLTGSDSGEEWHQEEKETDTSFVRAVRTLEREHQQGTPQQRAIAGRSGFVDMLPSQARLTARSSTGNLDRRVGTRQPVAGAHGSLGDPRNAATGSMVRAPDSDAESEFSVRDSLYGVPVGSSDEDDEDGGRARNAEFELTPDDSGFGGNGAVGQEAGPAGTQTTLTSTSRHTAGESSATSAGRPGAVTPAGTDVSDTGTPVASGNASMFPARSVASPKTLVPTVAAVPGPKSTPFSATAAMFNKSRVHPEPSDAAKRPNAAQARWKVVKRKHQVAAALGNAVDDARIYGSAANDANVPLTTNQLEVMDGRQMSAVSRRLCVLLPSSPVKQAWDLFVMALILYTSTIAPYRFGFGVEAEGTWAAVEIAIDILFMLDVVQQFFAAYQVENFVVVSHRRIASHYLRTWFVFDVLASIPVSLLDADAGTYNRQLRIVRVWKIFRLARLLRLLRIARLARTIPSLTRLFQLANLNPGFLRIFSFVFAFFLFSHWCACAWFFVALNEDLGPNTWVADANLVNASTFTHYMASIYWAWSTLTTLGYGDITAQNNGERLCTMVCMLFGVSFYSYITATMSTFLDGLDSASKIRREKSDELEQFIKTKHLTPDLSARVRDYFALLWRRQSAAFNENALMSRMSAGLQNEVIQQVYKDIIPKLPLFRNKDPHFVTRVVRRFVPVQYQQDRIVAREGTRAQDMVFIFKGRVRIESIATHAKFLDLPQGSMFGEIAILLTDKYVASYKTLTYCEFFVVHRQAFEEALLQFPDAEIELRQIAKRRLQRIKHVQERMARRYVGARGRLAWKRAARHAITSAKDKLRQSAQPAANNEKPLGMQGSLIRLLSRATGLSAGQQESNAPSKSAEAPSPSKSPDVSESQADRKADPKQGGSGTITGANLFGALVDAAVATHDEETPGAKKHPTRPKSAETARRKSGMTERRQSSLDTSANSPRTEGSAEANHDRLTPTATTAQDKRKGATESAQSADHSEAQATSPVSGQHQDSPMRRQKSRGPVKRRESDVSAAALLGDSLLQPGNLEAMNLSSPLLVSNVVLKLNFLVAHMQQLEERIAEMQSVQGQLATRALEQPPPGVQHASGFYSQDDEPGTAGPVFRVAGFGQRARMRAMRRTAGPLAQRAGVSASLASAEEGRRHAPPLGRGYTGGVSTRSTLNAGPDPEDLLYAKAGEDKGLEAVLESHIDKGGQAGRRR